DLGRAGAGRKQEDYMTIGAQHEAPSPWASFSRLALSSATTCASVSTKPSWALLASSAFEALPHRLQFVAQPHAAHAGERDYEPALAQLVGHSHLAEGRLLDRQRHNGVLDLLGNSVLQHRLLAVDLPQCQLAPVS